MKKCEILMQMLFLDKVGAMDQEESSKKNVIISVS
jgi:hypothetical protein